MWRRYGDVAFAVVVAVAVTLEGAGQSVLLWTLLRRLGGSAGPGPDLVVMGAIASTAVGLLLVTVYVLAYRGVSERRESVAAERRERWVQRWLRVLYDGDAPPDSPVDGDAVDALLDLRDTVRGTDAARVDDLLRRYGVSAALAREARSARVPTRLEAIDALSRGRFPDAMPALLAGLSDGERAVRVAAARAAARTLAVIDDGSDRDRAARDVVTALEGARLPLGIVEEMLLLAEDSAPALVVGLLRDRAPSTSLRAALDAVARLKLLAVGVGAARFLAHPDPEVRAAALRAIAGVGLLPPGDRPPVLAALRDEVDFVRIHATAAATLLPRDEAVPALWDRLGDRSWWVRRAAADAMAGLGPAGLGELGRAALVHPDRYARDMAAQTLRDRVPDLVEAVAG
jgi:HEAT repeat protein